MATILLIDDDPGIREVVRFALTRQGFIVLEAEDGISGLERANRLKPDLILLDIMMPGMDGLALCRELRRSNPVPIIFLSSRDEELDRVLGLELGGDDYIGKPFSPRELVSRVKAVLRRGAPVAASAAQPPLVIGRLRLDLDLVQAFWDDLPVTLTATEFALLRLLASRPGKLFSREALMDGAYGPAHYVSDRTIDSHIRRLRAKFQAVGGVPIETLHGQGYRLAESRCD